MEKTEADKILEATAAERRRFKKRDGQYKQRAKKEKVLSFTRQELIDFLTRNKIKGCTQLSRMRRPNIDPQRWHFRREFGTFKAALIEAFGKAVIPPDPPANARYIIDVMLQYDIQSVKKYLQIRKLHPDIVPSFNAIPLQFGRFSFAKYVARIACLRHMINDYIALKNKLKKQPTWDECKANGIDLGRILQHFKRKSNFDELVKELDNPLRALDKK